MTDWQPREMAPKDTEILLYGPSPDGPRVTMGFWMDDPDQLTNDFGEQGEPFWFSWCGGFTEKWPPTHWAPKPEPPDA